MSRLARLGAFSFRRRRLVLGAWIGALVAAFALSAAFGGAFSADYNTPGVGVQGAPLMRSRSASPRRSPDTIDVVWQTADGTPTAFLREAGTLPGLAPAGSATGLARRRRSPSRGCR